MSELTVNFQSLPAEYQHLIQLAEDQYKITIAPLQLLVGGWSGAFVYLVSISENETRRVEHCILKLDHKGGSARSDEVTRHTTVTEKSATDFAKKHIAELVFDRIEYEGNIAIFYRIAGQSLLNYLPVSMFGQQDQLKTIFMQTNTVLLDEWNGNATFKQAVHPQKVLEKWLSFRLEAGGNIEKFFEMVCRIDPDITGLLVNGNVFPNPLLYARKPEPWGKARPIDIATGFIHGDLNTNNILVKFTENNEDLEGYYLIDFALFKENMPLLYDQRYLEMSYLVHAMSQVSFEKCVNFLTLIADADILYPRSVPIEMSGISAVIESSRNAFSAWVQENHPSLHDDSWGQYWLAGVAAGLCYTHKAGQPDEQRLAGLIYAAANLKRYIAAFKLPLPTAAELLYDENQSDLDSHGIPRAKQPRHNLPVQPTPFIGRVTQIAAIKEMILDPDTHLVTLIGPGGTGKTRLSLQVAQELIDHFPDGVFFVPLADDRDANQLISRVAQQLGVREGGRPLLENVKDYLRDKHMLLVLDNFEQLVSSTPVVTELLSSAPKLKITVTSRIALNLYGECEFPVPPLELPHVEIELTVENLIKNESVILFVERARAVHPSFVLNKENASAVADICHRLDGLPLALELAAARIKILQPQDILMRLDDKLKLLTGGRRDLPTRHQTLRNTLEWSYDLLNQDEKTLYARLSVFVGGFTLEAAEAVCNKGGKLHIIEGLGALVDNSLLRQEESSIGETRFRMLETIREFAYERLTESGELDNLRERHAKYFSDVIARMGLGYELFSAKALSWLNWLERENDNIRATLTWELTPSGGIELAAAMVGYMNWFWYRRGYLIEGQKWNARILASPELQTASPIRMEALLSSGLLALWQGRPDTALAQFQEGLAIEQKLWDIRFLIRQLVGNGKIYINSARLLRGSGITLINMDHQIKANLLLGKGVALINLGRESEAPPCLKEALALYREQNMTGSYTIPLVHLGNAELGLGHPEQARALHEEALAEARIIDENWLISFALNNLGEVARTQGKFDQARKFYEESEALLGNTGDNGDLARFAHSLGYVAQHDEDFELAESQFRKSLTMFRRLGNRRGIAECLAGLAGLRARQGQTEWGTILLSAAESILKATGGAWWPADRIEVEQNRKIMALSLKPYEFTKAWKTGGEMNMDQAIAFASNEP